RSGGLVNGGCGIGLGDDHGGGSPLRSGRFPFLLGGRGGSGGDEDPVADGDDLSRFHDPRGNDAALCAAERAGSFLHAFLYDLRLLSAGGGPPANLLPVATGTDEG